MSQPKVPKIETSEKDQGLKEKCALNDLSDFFVSSEIFIIIPCLPRDTSAIAFQQIGYMITQLPEPIQ